MAFHIPTKRRVGESAHDPRLRVPERPVKRPRGVSNQHSPECKSPLEALPIHCDIGTPPTYPLDVHSDEAWQGEDHIFDTLDLVPREIHSDSHSALPKAVARARTICGRDALRDGYKDPSFHASSLPITPHPSPSRTPVTMYQPLDYSASFASTSDTHSRKQISLEDILGDPEWATFPSANMTQSSEDYAALKAYSIAPYSSHFTQIPPPLPGQLQGVSPVDRCWTSSSFSSSSTADSFLDESSAGDATTHYYPTYEDDQSFYPDESMIDTPSLGSVHDSCHSFDFSGEAVSSVPSNLLDLLREESVEVDQQQFDFSQADMTWDLSHDTAFAGTASSYSEGTFQSCTPYASHHVSSTSSARPYTPPTSVSYQIPTQYAISATPQPSAAAPLILHQPKPIRPIPLLRRNRAPAEPDHPFHGVPALLENAIPDDGVSGSSFDWAALEWPSDPEEPAATGQEMGPSVVLGSDYAKLSPSSILLTSVADAVKCGSSLSDEEEDAASPPASGSYDWQGAGTQAVPPPSSSYDWQYGQVPQTSTHLHGGLSVPESYAAPAYMDQSSFSFAANSGWPSGTFHA